MPDDFFARTDRLLLSSELPEDERANLRLRVVADHFCARDDHEPDDLARVLTALRDALACAAPAASARVAQRLASHPQADRELLVHLVERGGRTAAAALRSGAPFEEPFLAHLAEFGDELTAAAIAERSDLTRDLATILFRRPEREVLIALSGNRNVHLDRATAAWLVQRARRDSTLARVLLARGPLACDLTPLFLSADTEARAAMIVEARRRDIGLVPEFRTPLPAPVADGIDRAVVNRDRGDLAGILAQRLGLSRNDAARFIDDAGGEPLALACNAAGISPVQTEKILRWLQGGAADDLVVVMLMRLATKLVPQTARRIIASIVGRPMADRLDRTARAGPGKGSGVAEEHTGRLAGESTARAAAPTKARS